MKLNFLHSKNKQKIFNFSSKSLFLESQKDKSVLNSKTGMENEDKEEERRIKHIIYNLTSWDRTHIDLSPNTSQLNKSNFGLNSVISFCRKENNIKAIQEIKLIQSFPKGNQTRKLMRLKTKSNVVISNLSISHISDIKDKKQDFYDCNIQLHEQKEPKTEQGKRKNELMEINEIQNVNQLIKNKKKELDKLNLIYGEIINQINHINSDFEGAIYDLSSMMSINPQKNTDSTVKSILTMKCRQNSFNESIQKEIAKLVKEVKILLDDNIKLKSEINETISVFEEELKYLKEIYEKLRQKQIEYYTNILIQGKDTREKGLVWIIIRLFSLKALVDESMFPSFLKNNQIKYLLKIGKLNFQVKKYQKKVKTLKDKLNMIYKLPKMKLNLNQKMDLFKNNINLLHDFKENNTLNCIKRLKNLILNNRNNISATNDNIIINKIKACHNQSHAYYSYFNELKNLRENISLATNEINELTNNQLNKYRDEYKNSQILFSIDTVKSKLVYGALFGNRIL